MRESSEEKNNAREITQNLVKSVINEFGSIKCIDLKRNGISCDDIIEFAYNKVNDLV